MDERHTSEYSVQIYANSNKWQNLHYDRQEIILLWSFYKE